MKRACSDDIPTLVSLMGAFYAESGYALDGRRAEKAFAALLTDERLGCAWLIAADGQAVGYVVLTFRFAMEYGGWTAGIDDLYVEPASRNRGLGSAAVVEVRQFCIDRDIRAVTVEVGTGDDAAQAVYHRMGMAAAPGRQLLVLPLAEPIHDP